MRQTITQVHKFNNLNKDTAVIIHVDIDNTVVPP
jgi:hypothetical protein